MINYVNVGGKKRPLYFGMNGIRLFCKEYNIPLQDFADAFTKLDMDKAICMVTIALNEGERKANGTAKYNVDQVSDFFDQDFDAFGEATTAIMENLPFKAAETNEKKPAQKAKEGNARKQVVK